MNVFGISFLFSDYSFNIGTPTLFALLAGVVWATGVGTDLALKFESRCRKATGSAMLDGYQVKTPESLSAHFEAAMKTKKNDG